jgi:hypothetical protein
LHLSHETLFREARKLNEERKQYDHENYIANSDSAAKKLIPVFQDLYYSITGKNQTGFPNE